MKILILANHYNTLRIFRRELLQKLSGLGHELVVSLPETDEENISIIESYGCRVVIEPEMERRGNNPIKDIALLMNYIKLIKKEKPEKIITYTIKCNIYGAEAAKTPPIAGGVHHSPIRCKRFLAENSLCEPDHVLLQNRFEIRRIPPDICRDSKRPTAIGESFYTN